MKILALLSFLVIVVSPAYAARPNILFILIDDLGWMDLHCQGNANLETPNIDALAEEGIRHQRSLRHPRNSHVHRHGVVLDGPQEICAHSASASR